MWFGPLVHCDPHRGKQHLGHSNSPFTGNKHSKQAGAVFWFGPIIAGFSFNMSSRGSISLVATKYLPTYQIVKIDVIFFPKKVGSGAILVFI